MKIAHKIIALLLPLVFMAINMGEASTVRYAVPLQDNVKIFDNRTGEFIPVATMKKISRLLLIKNMNKIGGK